MTDSRVSALADSLAIVYICLNHVNIWPESESQEAPYI
jgi:hypothetical protein